MSHYFKNGAKLGDPRGTKKVQETPKPQEDKSKPSFGQLLTYLICGALMLFLFIRYDNKYDDIIFALLPIFMIFAVVISLIPKGNKTSKKQNETETLYNDASPHKTYTTQKFQSEDYLSIEDFGVELEDICEYCGSAIKHGTHLRCPNCGAPLPKIAEASLNAVPDEIYDHDFAIKPGEIVDIDNLSDYEKAKLGIINSHTVYEAAEIQRRKRIKQQKEIIRASKKMTPDGIYYIRNPQREYEMNLSKQITNSSNSVQSHQNKIDTTMNNINNSAANDVELASPTRVNIRHH